MLVADRIIELLGRERAEHIVGFPENRLLNSAAAAGMRPIITRTERVAVNIAAGFARATNGERLLPCVAQYGPGAEAAFAAVAQAYGDRSPILLLPSEHAVDAQEDPQVRSEVAYRPITRFLATVNDAAKAPEVFRRALVALRGARNGPVLVVTANDVLNGAAGMPTEPDVAAALSQADPADVAQTAKALLGARHPVIVAGQGVLYAGATAELLALAERTGTPVATTLNGKSAFPENHPLSLGIGGFGRASYGSLAATKLAESADVILTIVEDHDRARCTCRCSPCDVRADHRRPPRPRYRLRRRSGARRREARPAPTDRRNRIARAQRRRRCRDPRIEARRGRALAAQTHLRSDAA